MKFKKQLKMVEHKLTYIVGGCRNFAGFCNFTNKANLHTSKEKIHTRQKLCHFGGYVAKAKVFCPKGFVSVTRAGASI